MNYLHPRLSLRFNKKWSIRHPLNWSQVQSFLNMEYLRKNYLRYRERWGRVTTLRWKWVTGSGLKKRSRCTGLTQWVASALGSDELTLIAIFNLTWIYLGCGPADCPSLAKRPPSDQGLGCRSYRLSSHQSGTVPNLCVSASYWKDLPPLGCGYASRTPWSLTCDFAMSKGLS